MGTSFKVQTPTPGFTGLSAGVNFTNGEADVDADVQLASLRYFATAGYRIDPDPSDVLRAAEETPEQEVVRLKRENAELTDRLKLEDLRKQNEELRGKVEQQQVITGKEQAGEGSGPKTETLLVPPAEDAPVSEWRDWVVRSERGKEADVRGKSRAELVSTYGSAYDADRAAQLQANSDSVKGGGPR